MFKCNSCDDHLSSKCSLRAHKESIHDKIRYECDICHKLFTQNEGLVKHKSIVHEGKKKDCDQCDYKGGSKTILKAHIAVVHEGVRYNCGMCADTFASISAQKSMKARDITVISVFHILVWRVLLGITLTPHTMEIYSNVTMKQLGRKPLLAIRKLNMTY